MDAARDYRAFLAARPDFGPALTNLGLACYGLRDFPQAGICLERALAVDPGDARAWNGLGAVHLDCGRPKEAEACLRRAAELAPRSPDAFFNLAKLCVQTRRFDEAEAAFETVRALAPGRVEPLLGLCRVHYQAGRIEAALAVAEEACAAAPGHPYAETSRLLVHSYRRILGVTALREAHMAFGRAFCDSVAKELPPPRPQPRNARLRVGYLAWNWFNHPNLRCALPVLSAHDPERVEVFAYHLGEESDALTARLQGTVERWRDCRGLPPAEVARRIHQDGLTILVGQEGYFQDAVVQVMARRVAPVQVAWSGYPHGWGLPTVDARITDTILDPPAWDGLPGFERLVRLPWFRSFLPPADAPDPGPLPALAKGHATFVSFNNLAKIGEECLDLWARVLAAVPAARLTVAQAEAGRLRDDLAARMAAAGLPMDRITFLPRLPEAEYLRLHREADLHLDTAPYPGVTVSATALWMGLPSVCLNQDWAAAREGAAQVVTAGFPELVADSPEAFVALNAKLASDLPALAAFRANARERMRASSLLDGAGLARNLEDAYFRLADAAR